MIAKRLIQDHNNETRVQVEPRLCNQVHCKNDAFALSATLLAKVIGLSNLNLSKDFKIIGYFFLCSQTASYTTVIVCMIHTLLVLQNESNLQTLAMSSLTLFYKHAKFIQLALIFFPNHKNHPDSYL